MTIFAEVTKNKCIIERHLRMIDASLICVGAFSMSESHSMLSIWLKWTYQHYMALVCPSVCHTHDPCLNASTYRNAFALYNRAMLDARSFCSSWASCSHKHWCYEQTAVNTKSHGPKYMQIDSNQRNSDSIFRVQLKATAQEKAE